MTTEITYRLGHLTGQLKGVDQKEDLKKIAAGLSRTWLYGIVLNGMICDTSVHLLNRHFLF